MKRFILAFLILAMLVVSPSMSVMAIADPDSPPAINSVYVYELSDGGIGVLIDYTLDYAVLPTETATEAYMAVFIDTDGTTQLKAVAPYAYNDSGYGRGLIWIPFTQAEVTAYGLTSASSALYSIWLVGNPTLAWPTTPPLTVGTIDLWQEYVSATPTLLALRILTLAGALTVDWAFSATPLTEITASGTKLTSVGEDYIVNVITNARTIAPNAFSSGSVSPISENVTYEREFGAVADNGTGVITGAPVTLSQGSNNITVTTVGTILITLTTGTTGNVSSGTGTVTGSPVTLQPGINTITVPAGGTGNLTVVVNLRTTQTQIDDTITGTGLDLTLPATTYGMSRNMFSGLVWLLVTVVICAAVYKNDFERQKKGFGGGGGKAVLVVLDICIIGGTVLGLLTMIVGTMLFIVFGVITGYTLFFRQASF